MSAISFVRLLSCMGFPGGSDSKESTCNSRDPDSNCNSRDPDSITGLVRSPGKGNDNPFQYSCLENPHGQRSLVGYSPWDCKESDTTEQLTLLHYHSWTHQKQVFKMSPWNFLQGSASTDREEREKRKTAERNKFDLFSSIQSSCRVWLFATPWTVAHPASLSITNSQSLPKLMSIESVMPSNHLILCCPLLFLLSIILVLYM